MPFLLGCIALTCLDVYLSYVRMRSYGHRVELNPIARQLAADSGVPAAIVFLSLYNAALLSIVSGYPTILHILFGARLGLAAMQLKSLQLETMVDKLLRKANESQSSRKPSQQPPS